MAQEEARMLPHEAVEQVRTHGDVIDNTASLRGVVGSVAGCMATAALATPIGWEIGQGFNYGYSVEVGLPYVIYAPVALGAAHVYTRWRRGQQYRRAEGAQEAIDESLGEPVDVFRIGKGKQQGLAIRWYGFEYLDEDQPLPVDFVDRAKTIASFAREHDIATIVAPIPEKYTGDYERVDGTAFITDAKRLKNVVITDYAAAPSLLRANVAEFERVIDACEGEQHDSLLVQLVEHLNNPLVSRRYAEFVRGNQHATVRAGLRAAVREAIEMTATDAHAMAEKQPDGTVVRKKVHSAVTVLPAGAVQRYDTSIDHETGEGTIAMAGRGALASLSGHRSNQVFLQDLLKHGTESRSKLELLTGLQLLLDAYDEREVRHRTLLSGDSADDRSAAPFWYRVGEAEGAVRIVARQRYAAKKVGQKLAALAVGVGLGVGIGHAATASFEHDSDKFAAYAKAHKSTDNLVPFDTKDKTYEAYQHDPHSGYSPLDRKLYDTLFHLDDRNGELSQQIAKVLIEDLHLTGLEAYLPDYLQTKVSNWFQGLQAEQAGINSGDSTANQNQMDYGDVPGKSDKILYTINPLTDQSTKGYWAMNEYGDLEITSGSPPFTGGGVAMTGVAYRDKPVKLPSDPNTIMAKHPDFMVDTPFLSINTNTAMPVRDDTVLVGAQIFDAANPSHPYITPEIMQEPDGSYQLARLEGNGMQGAMASLNMQQPTLRYWLKVAPGNTMMERLPDDPVFSVQGVFYKRDMVQVAEATKKALGLPSDASALAVLEAIQKGKEYSYTPFARAGISSVPVPQGASDTAILETVGRTLASLKAMNCNIASMTMLLTTLDQQQPPYVQLGGYHNTDGKPYLTQQEAHAWLGNRTTSAIVDPTPVRMAPGEEVRGTPEATKEPSRSKALDIAVSPEDAAGVLLAAVFGYVAWRRRRFIAEKTDALRAAATLSPLAMQATIRRAEHERYGGPTEFIFTPARDAEPTSTVARRYAFHLPQAPTIKSDVMPELLRRLVLRLNDGAIRRYVARTAPVPSRDSIQPDHMQ